MLFCLIEYIHTPVTKPSDLPDPLWVLLLVAVIILWKLTPSEDVVAAVQGPAATDVEALLAEWTAITAATK